MGTVLSNYDNVVEDPGVKGSSEPSCLVLPRSQQAGVDLAGVSLHEIRNPVCELKPVRDFVLPGTAGEDTLDLFPPVLIVRPARLDLGEHNAMVIIRRCCPSRCL